jgi:DNA repair exonuclease SbcCD ATPase subunit
MSSIRIKGISIENYRSFGERKNIVFPKEDYKKPIAIVGYNAGKTTLLNAILLVLLRDTSARILLLEMIFIIEILIMCQILLQV